jgi:hypothetical protein
MKRAMILLAAAGLSSCVCTRQAPKAVPLFNGRDLAGWSAFSADPSVPVEKVWQAKDGILVCAGEPMGYLHTDASFTNYRLSLEYRWAPGKAPGNSGVFGRIHGEPRPLPCCFETQLQHGKAGDVYAFHGMKLAGDPARFKQSSGGKLAGDLSALSRIAGSEKPAGEWNAVEVLADGPAVTVWINGAKVNEATGAEVVAGPVGLQSEGGEVHFRNVRIQPLP